MTNRPNEHAGKFFRFSRERDNGDRDERHSQLLDHMFASRSLLDDAEFDVVHVNVDFPVLFGEVEARDHEPLVARFRLD